MFRKFLILLVCFFSCNSHADDWGAPASAIETMYIYPTYVVVVHSTAYSGLAGCNANHQAAWSFYWSDFDSATQQRIYSALLAARLSKAQFKPVFSSTDCGPEGYKKFNGLFSM